MSSLVGRELPAAVLAAEVDRTLASHGGLVLVAGEAGIGKSSVVAGAVAAARAGGALVAVGTCWDREGAPGHWPWVQVVRALARLAPADAWTAARTEAGGELAALLDGDGAGLGGAAADAFGLQDAVSTLLAALAREQPVVVVVEDLHWADEASLRLLEFVARHGWYERLLLIGTYRDGEVEGSDHPRAAGITALVAKATTVALGGLDRGQVGTLVAATTGRTAPAPVIDELHRRTGGNPFFVEQTARLWQSRGAIDAVPPGVRDVVEHRLTLLPAATRDALATVALLGHAPSRVTLAGAFDVDEAGVDAVLGDAVTAGLLDRTDEGFAFVHDLVRETLADGLDPADARRRHAAIVACFDRPDGPDGSDGPDRPGRPRAPAAAAAMAPGDLAHHAHAAGDAVDLDRRVALLQAAARLAAGRMAVDEAEGHLRRALDAIPSDRPRDRAFAQVELGWMLMRTGDVEGCRRVFESAARLALDLDDPALLTRAALSLRSAVWLVAEEHEHVAAAELVDEAHRRLVVEGGRASEATTSWGREQELTAIALEMCRSSGDDQAIWDALTARHDAVWAPGTEAERIDLADEMAVVARRNGAPGREVEALGLRLLDLVEAGDPRLPDAHATFQARARQVDSTWSRSRARWVGAVVAVLQGRFDDGRAELDEAMAIDARAGVASDDLVSLHLQVRWAVEHQQGRDDAVDALLDRIAEVHPHPDLLRAVTAVGRGEVERAARTVAERRGAGAEPGRWFAPLWLRLRAEVAGATADADLAAGLADELRPVLAGLAGRWALMPHGAVDGPYDLWAGVVEAGQGCHDEAVARFAVAAASADALGATPWAVEARTRLLASRRGRGEEVAAEAAVLADEARTLGLARLVARLSALAEPDTAGSPGTPGTPGTATARGALPTQEPLPARSGTAAVTPTAQEALPARSGTGAPPQDDEPGAPSPGTGTAPGDGSGRDDDAAVFRRSGDVWELAYAGTTVHVPDAKGIRDIHVLLARPGMGVRAVDLLDPEAGAVGRAARAMGGDDVLDERAKAAYRTRLTQLDEEIDAALAGGADRRAAELDHERAALIDELRRATGLGGRSRRLGDDAERARKAVRERIRDTIRRLAPVHPALADHLREAVRTGATCSYEPSDPVDWRR